MMRREATVLSLIAAMALVIVAQDVSAQQARRGKGWTPHVVVGQEAPDLELPLLQFKKDAQGKEVGTISTNTVRISSFRGKKVVCIFFSSYT
jgi:hypothetical protein